MVGKTEFQQIAKEMFKKLKEQPIENLLIDQRNNGGGSSDIGDILISYLVDKPFNQFDSIEVKTSRATKSMDRPSDLRVNSAGVIIINQLGLLNPQVSEKHFDGDVYVLTNHMTFSSAANLAWVLKKSERIKTIGEETGGMSISFGNTVQIKLPISDIGINISFAKFYQSGADESDIHGVLPDYPCDAKDALTKALGLIDKPKE